MLHQVEFVIPARAAGKGGMAPDQRVAELQRAGHEEGSGGSLEGISELQPIPKLSPRAAAEEEADYGQMVEEMQQVCIIAHTFGTAGFEVACIRAKNDFDAHDPYHLRLCIASK